MSYSGQTVRKIQNPGTLYFIDGEDQVKAGVKMFEMLLEHSSRESDNLREMHETENQRCYEFLCECYKYQKGIADDTTKSTSEREAARNEMHDIREEINNIRRSPYIANIIKWIGTTIGVVMIVAILKNGRK